VICKIMLRTRLAGLVTCLAATVVTAAQAASDEPARLWWRMPAAPDLAWRGLLPTDGGAVGIGPQIGPYVVPGPAGLLVAVFAHGAIMQGVQSAQRKREQDDADKVLEPYSGSLKSWPALSLWQAAAGGTDMLWDGVAPAPGAVMELLPVLSIAQDESAILLDVAIKITRAPTESAGKANEVIVRVISSPPEAGDARMHWSTDDAKQLKATAAAMLAHAVDVAIRHANAKTDIGPEPPPAARTYRYLQGRVERTERAQQLVGDCARAVLRTLRGGLLSVPLRQAAGETCEVKTTF
jgi:hypothetical protein